MNILTWNINGIRATSSPLKCIFDSLNADVVCLQETKVTRDQLDEPTAIVEGYSSYFSFCKIRAGYSGVATYCKQNTTPFKTEEGLSGLLSTGKQEIIGYYGDQSHFLDEELRALDSEGRALITQHKIIYDAKPTDLYIINVYCPRADPEREDRKDFKLRFYKVLQLRAEALLATGGHVVIVGDVNTSHRQIDHCDPEPEKEFNDHDGRRWLSQFLKLPTTENTEDTPHMEEGKFIDTFRYFHPNETKAFTCWNTSTGARQTNYGTRIDYIFADVDLTVCVNDCVIMPHVEGSDHCPVRMELHCEPVPSTKHPASCTKHFPEFAGKQQKLLSFLCKTSKPKSDTIVENKTEEIQLNSMKMKRIAEPLQKAAKKKKLDTSCKQLSVKSYFMFKPSKGSSSDSETCSSQKETTAQQFAKDSVPINMEEATKHNENLAEASSKKVNLWKGIFQSPKIPLCKGHTEMCVLRTVKKDSLNKGRQFYVCARPQGLTTDPEARCDHFEWVDKKKKM